LCWRQAARATLAALTGCRAPRLMGSHCRSQASSRWGSPPLYCWWSLRLQAARAPGLARVMALAVVPPQPRKPAFLLPATRRRPARARPCAWVHWQRYPARPGTRMAAVRSPFAGLRIHGWQHRQEWGVRPRRGYPRAARSGWHREDGWPPDHPMLHSSRAPSIRARARGIWFPRRRLPWCRPRRARFRLALYWPLAPVPMVCPGSPHRPGTTRWHRLRRRQPPRARPWVGHWTAHRPRSAVRYSLVQPLRLQVRAGPSRWSLADRPGRRASAGHSLAPRVVAAVGPGLLRQRCCAALRHRVGHRSVSAIGAQVNRWRPARRSAQTYRAQSCRRYETVP